jgi:hypothetical protein
MKDYIDEAIDPYIEDQQDRKWLSDGSLQLREKLFEVKLKSLAHELKNGRRLEQEIHESKLRKWAEFWDIGELPMEEMFNILHGAKTRYD